MDEVDLRLGWYHGNVQELLAALDSAGVRGVLLELDGVARELHDFIVERSAGDPDLLARNRQARRSYRRVGRVIFGGQPLTLPVEDDTLKELRDLAERFAGPEIAVSLAVHERDGTLVIEAPDVGTSEIWVNSKRLDSVTVDALQMALRASLS